MTSMADPISAGSPRLPRLLSGAERESAMDRLSVEFNALSSSNLSFLILLLTMTVIDGSYISMRNLFQEYLFITCMNRKNLVTSK